jgi:hypothetical protein
MIVASALARQQKIQRRHRATVLGQQRSECQAQRSSGFAFSRDALLLLSTDRLSRTSRESE